MACSKEVTELQVTLSNGEDDPCQKIVGQAPFGADDEAPPSTDRQAGGPLEASTGLKLKCLIYTLVLISIGFVTSVIETQAFNKRSLAKTMDRLPIEWVCYGVKCAFILPAIGALLFLQHSAIVPGKVAKVELQVISSNSERPAGIAQKMIVILTNVDRFVHLPKQLSKSPSKLFMLTSLLFAFFSCLAIVVEATCGIIDIGYSTDSNVAPEISELFRKFFIFIFIVLQTRFFLFNSRVCIQWKLSSVCFSTAHILAANVSTWIINIGFELREVIDEKANQLSASLYCTNNSVSSYARALFPFIVEYYVMNALLAVALLANTGRLAIAIRKSPIAALSSNYIAGLLQPTSVLRNDHSSKTQGRYLETEYTMLKAHSGTVLLGIFLVLLTLAVSIFLRNLGKEQFSALVTFYSAIMTLSVCGLVGSVFLLRALKARVPEQHLSHVHKMDRMLLWIGASAIALNDAYTFWISCSNLTGGEVNATHDNCLVTNALQAVTAALNIAQSLVQVYALECALMRKFSAPGDSPQQSLYGRALLTLLILLNASQWLINTICFNFFFRHHQVEGALALSLLTIPLQVFFRFHSIACIHDFKNHCAATWHETEGAMKPGESLVEQQADLILRVEYPQGEDF